jgi:hypothetical protein
MGWFDEIVTFFLNPLVSGFIGGLVGFLLGIMKRFLDVLAIEPVFNYYKIQKDVATVLFDYSREITSPGIMPIQNIRDAEINLRRVARDIQVFYSTFKYYKLFEKIHLIPKKDNLIKSQGLLIRISNCLNRSDKALDNYYDDQNIKKLMNLK